MTERAASRVTRRQLLKHVGLASGVLACRWASGAGGPAATRRRPNVLLLLADDWSWPHASILGDPVVKTPVFDRLARRGVLFERAFVSAPSCTPSRGSILTGEYHWRLGHAANLGGSLLSGKVTYPERLASAGYHVGHSGKGFWPTENLGRDTKPAGTRYAGFQEFMAARPAGRPFCFWFGGLDPHRPYDEGCGVRSGLDPTKVRVPETLPDHDVVRRDLCDYYWEVQRFDRKCGAILDHLRRIGELDNTLVLMAGDNGMPFPRHKATLYDGGVRVPLAVSWGDRAVGGRRVTDFVSLCDLAPTILEAAGLARGEAMTGRSLMPILESSASGPVDPERTSVVVGMERHCTPYPRRAIRTAGFLYVRNYEPATWDPGPEDFAFNYNIDPSPTKAYMMAHRNAPGMSEHDEQAFGKPPPEELFDLQRDPGQVTNVADDPRYADVKRRLANQLRQRLRATGDPRVLGHPEAFDEWE